MAARNCAMLVCDPRLSAFSVRSPKKRSTQVEPRGARRREMKVDTRMAKQPPLHERRAVRGQIVEDDVDVEGRGNVRFRPKKAG
jgi:hypothetical protein